MDQQTKNKRESQQTPNKKGKADRVNQKSVQRSANRGSNHDLRRVSAGDLEAAAMQFAAADKSALAQTPNVSSTPAGGAASSDNKDDGKLNSTAQSGAGTSPTQLNPLCAEFTPKLNSTLVSGADTNEANLMEQTIIHKTEIEPNAASTASLTNAISSTPKGGAALASQNAASNISIPFTMHENDAAKSSITSTLRFGPKVASNTDANMERSGPNKQKKKRRGGKRYQEAKRLKQQLSNAASAASNANSDETPRNTWRDANAKPNRGAANKSQHTIGARPSGKRTRTYGETPPDAVQKPKRQSTNGAVRPSTSTGGPTMAQAVKDANLTVAIVDMPTEGIISPLTKERYDKIYASIDRFVFAEIEQGKLIPTFDENKFTRGVMKLRCSTPGAKSWLSCAVRYIPPEWPGMNLFMVDFDKIPVPVKVLGLFKNNNLNAEQILRILNSMNASVNTSRWNVIRMKTTDKGTHVVFDIDEEQHAVLSGCNFSLFFGAGTALFKDLSKKQSGTKAQNVEVDLSLSDLDLDDDNDDRIEVTIKPSSETVLDAATKPPTNIQQPIVPSTAAHDTQNISGAAKQGNDNAVNTALNQLDSTVAQETPGAQA